MNQPKKNAVQTGTVKQSTLIICIILSLLAGLFFGYVMGLAIAAYKGDGGETTMQVKSSPKNPADDPKFARLQQDVSVNPQDPEAWNLLGHWYFDNGMPKEAIKTYESSLVLKPGDPNVITNMGVMYRDLHDHEKALELFRQASALDKNHLQSRFNQGIVLYFDLKREDEAITVWSDLLKLAPEYRAPNGSRLADMVNDIKK